MDRSELNKKARNHLDNAGIGTGTNITLHAAKCLMVDFYIDNQVKNNVDLADVMAALPTRKVCFFALKKGRYLTENGMEITTEMLVKYPHQITKNLSFIVLD